MDDGHLLAMEEDVEDLVSSITLLRIGDCNESPSRIDIVERIRDFLRMIPRNNKQKSLDCLQVFELFEGHFELVELLDSPIKGNKEIGEESIRLFLNPKIDFLPRSVHNQCASIILDFCSLLRETLVEDDDDKLKLKLYNSCRETLGYLLKSIRFNNRSRYLGNSEAPYLIRYFYPFVSELSEKLIQGLDIIKDSSLFALPTCFRLDSFENDIREFAVFSLHFCWAIEDHVRSKGHSLPLNVEGKFAQHHPCSLGEIIMFNVVFFDLRWKIMKCLEKLKKDILGSKGKWKFNPGWSCYLSVLKELFNISKLFQGVEERLSSSIWRSRFSLDILIMFTERSDDHLWLLEHKNLIDFNSRRHLVLMMFPKVKDDSNDEKLHDVLVDRSQLLMESFEHITHANPKSLRNGLFVEFKNEEATGHGVLREWLFLLCQALFSSENSLFLACASDRRRFFPNPATMDPQQLNYFAFCGRVIAFALMHKVQVGISFDRMFFLQLSGEVISLEDVRYADPCLYNSCKKILELDADFMDSDALGLTFVREIEKFGSRKVVELCSGGNTIVVNSKNRKEYVELLIQHCFVESISEKVAYFARGFGDILCKRGLQKVRNFFQSLELKDLDLMLLGSDKAICVKDWKAHTDYNGYEENDDQICWFWKVVEGMSEEQRRMLLFFWTSVKYLPVKGFSSLASRLYIFKTSGSDYHLPSSYTCFYRLCLPHYPSLAVMRQHLFHISQEHMGCSFGNL